MDTDDRDAHPPAMRWLFGEYTAAEAGNRPGLGRPTRRRGETRTRRRQAADREHVPASSTISPRPGLTRPPWWGVGAQPFGCDEAAVGSLATVTAAGARSRHEIKGPSEVQDEVPRGELVSVRVGLGPARGRDAVALCRHHGALLHESSRARTRPTDRILTCRGDMTRVGRARSSD